MTPTDKPSLSIVELQEQLAFFQNRCLVLRAEVEKRDVRIKELETPKTPAE
tara:strand:+ start:551 stop:703 length:153 start_codon:yes stop_codon:yes gene_type:complete